MPLWKLYLRVYGMHLILANVSPFVLLTANFEDIKKLAQKFVNNPMAKEITKFITKLNDNQIDISKENKVNYNDINKNTHEDMEIKDTENTKVFKNIDKSDSEPISEENLNYNDFVANEKIKTRFVSKTSKDKTNENSENKNPYLIDSDVKGNNKNIYTDSDSTEEIKNVNDGYEKTKLESGKSITQSSDKKIYLKLRAVATSGTITLPKLDTKE